MQFDEHVFLLKKQNQKKYFQWLDDLEKGIKKYVNEKFLEENKNLYSNDFIGVFFSLATIKFPFFSVFGKNRLSIL